MRLNNKGFAISTILYLILVVAIILITVTLTLLSSRKLILDKMKKETLNNIYGEDIYIIYDNNGGKGCSKQKVVYNQEIGEMCTPTKSGYEFLGWYKRDYKNNPLNYYADEYVDLYDAFGYNPNLLYNHYKSNGLGERRRISQYLSTDIYSEKKDIIVYAGWYKNLTCTIETSGNKKISYNNINWYNLSANLSLQKSIDISGYDITDSNIKSYNNKDKITSSGRTSSLGKNYYGYVKDNYGNEGNCVKTIGIYDENDLPSLTGSWTKEILANGNKCCVNHVNTYLGYDNGQYIGWTLKWHNNNTSSDGEELHSAADPIYLCASSGTNSLTVTNITVTDVFNRPKNFGSLTIVSGGTLVCN